MKHVVTLVRSRETKHKIVFEEVGTTEEDQVFGSLYIWKNALKVLGNPKKIKATIEVG